jgi:hypothetical protein
MRISEITSSNEMWAAMHDIDFDSAFDSFALIVDVWPIIVNSKSPTRIAAHKSNLLGFIDLIDYVLSKISTFPDQTDLELSQFEMKFQNMRNTIEKMIA